MKLPRLSRRRTVLVLAGLVALSVCVAFLLREPKRTPTGDPLPEEAVRQLSISEPVLGYDFVNSGTVYYVLIVENRSDWNVTAIRFNINGNDVWLTPEGKASVQPSSKAEFRYSGRSKRSGVRGYIRGVLNDIRDRFHINRPHEGKTILAAEGFKEPSSTPDQAAPSN